MNMSIENDLKRIADAVEKLVESLTADKRPATVVDKMGDVVKPAKKAMKVEALTPTTPPQQASVSKDQLVDALRDVVLKKNPTVAKEVLHEFGAGRISEVKESDYAACYKALQEVANG
jgi:hypothetical protein